MPNSPSDETSPSPSDAPTMPQRPRRLAVSLPGFLPPSHPSPSDPSPLERTEDPSLEPAAADSAPDWSAPQLDDELPEAAPSRRKTGASPASSPVSKGAYEDAARRVVLILAELAHQTSVVRDPATEPAGVWLPDEQDVNGIAEPAAAIVYRRQPALGGDLVDGITLAIAVAGYVTKQFQKLRAIRAARRGFQLDADTENEAPQ